MKRRIFGLLLLLALLLTACGGESEPKSSVYPVEYLGTTYYVDLAQGTVTCGEDVYTFTVSVSGDTRSTKITYPNGATYNWTDTGYGGAGGASEGYDEVRYVDGFTLINIIDQAGPSRDTRDRQGNPLLGFVCILIGALNLAFPQIGWYLRYGWHFKDAEPSDLAIGMARLGGGVVILIGIILIFI